MQLRLPRQVIWLIFISFIIRVRALPHNPDAPVSSDSPDAQVLDTDLVATLPKLSNPLSHHSVGAVSPTGQDTLELDLPLTESSLDGLSELSSCVSSEDDSGDTHSIFSRRAERDISNKPGTFDLPFRVREPICPRNLQPVCCYGGQYDKYMMDCKYFRWERITNCDEDQKFCCRYIAQFWGWMLGVDCEQPHVGSENQYKAPAMCQPRNLKSGKNL